MNLLLFTDEDRLDARRIAVGGRRLQHMRQVHRASPGDSIRVGELGGNMGRGTIVEITAQRAVIEVSADAPPPVKLSLELILALPRPKMLRRVLRTVAECGVPRLHLLNSYRVEKSYWQSPALAPDTIRDYLLQGLEQSGDTVLPDVVTHRLFRPFVEDTLPGLLADRRALLAHPGDHPPCPRDLDEPTVLVIGPEGGFIPYEVAKLQETGCRAVSLGPRVLRVETAVASLLGRLA
jgi:RsmE family RNA methyltransferase